jgi:hypothetical protein
VVWKRGQVIWAEFMLSVRRANLYGDECWLLLSEVGSMNFMGENKKTANQQNAYKRIFHRLPKTVA